MQINTRKEQTKNRFFLILKGMKKFLVIDTATPNCSITILYKDKSHSMALVNKNQTKELIPLIKELLEYEQILLSDLTAIAICIGPGTFTGTRVGVMTAKALSYGSDIPLITFSTPDLFNEHSPHCKTFERLYDILDKSPLVFHQHIKLSYSN
jgi:tRNA threonylcarbamoyladenosine biosynthesis protein TsaB